MLYEEFVKEVERYGCGDIIDTKEMLLICANQAMYDLYNYIPSVKTLKLYARGYKPIVYYREIAYDGSSPLVIPTSGKAYSMRVMGRGNYTISDGTMVNVYSFDTGRETRLIQGFISDGGYIKFWGGFSFTVFNFAIYDDLLSPEIEDIPDGSEKTIYDMRRLCSDFLAFSSVPTDAEGKAIENCRICDGKLETDSDYIGEINIKYRRLPARIMGIEKTEENDGETIDISDELLPLLIYLIWYNHWLGSDEGRAKHYKTKFDNLLSLYNDNIMTYDKRYIDVNGWA